MSDMLFVTSREEEPEWVGLRAQIRNGVVYDTFEEKLKKAIEDEDAAKKEAEEQKKRRDETVPNASEAVFVDHVFEARDNMQLLCLRYGCAEGDVIRSNGLVGGIDFVEPGRVLRIPATRIVDMPRERKMTTAEVRERSIRIFMRLNHVPITKEESIFYLDDNDWDLRKAYHARALDMEWENANPHPTQAKPAGKSKWWCCGLAGKKKSHSSH
ncbi:hypothetical protein DIPPA_09781 [Diplonema papillatum]|nr:hypothetical protein DIPPA_09781 [Diplonema papillatum]